MNNESEEAKQTKSSGSTSNPEDDKLIPGKLSLEEETKSTNPTTNDPVAERQSNHSEIQNSPAVVTEVSSDILLRLIVYCRSL